MMSAPIALLILLVVCTLFYFTARTLVRELKTGVPHLFFSPHPAYRHRPVNRRGIFFWFSVGTRAFGVVGLALMTAVALAFLVEALGGF
jgi:hypothetical protein